MTGAVMGPPSLLRAETKVILTVKQSAIPLAMGPSHCYRVTDLST
jgi:hypothetical protein